MNNGQYLGHVRRDDPLYGYLRHEIHPQTGRPPERAKYRVFRLNASNDVFLYEEKYSGAKFIGKFFHCGRTKDAGKAAARLTHEFDNLKAMRGCGLTGTPHHVARPLGRNYALNALLVTEICEGELLSKVILAAIHNGEQEKLFRRLTALAYFFS
ncbi:MAG: aminoglycoside phosphotransferase family protein, partial [Candidatus Electrothrix sp. AR5]|nr:aminoglycoside phosphotransferase family protein [Candidatus Electrothrix sp. AR5]